MHTIVLCLSADSTQSQQIVHQVLIFTHHYEWCMMYICFKWRILKLDIVTGNASRFRPGLRFCPRLLCSSLLPSPSIVRGSVWSRGRPQCAENQKNISFLISPFTPLLLLILLLLLLLLLGTSSSSFFNSSSFVSSLSHPPHSTHAQLRLSLQRATLSLSADFFIPLFFSSNVLICFSKSCHHSFSLSCFPTRSQTQTHSLSIPVGLIPQTTIEFRT